jgi:transcriptional regulator with XRE-family HTH domain
MLEKIQTLAKERGISMKELERACELGNGAIAKSENSSPRVDNIKKVADYFGVPVDYFLEVDK